jgi:hypothetical protein
MKTDIQNWTVELHNDLIYIKKDGKLIKAFLVKAAEAVDKYNSFIVKVEKMLAGQKQTS